MERAVTITDIQVRFADTDMLGHINNVNQQHYFDLGKSDFFRKILGIIHPMREQGVIAAATTSSYFAQALPSEDFYVETQAESIGTKSITLAQRLIARQTGEVKSESRSVMVAFDFISQQSIPVPEQWKEAAGFKE